MTRYRNVELVSPHFRARLTDGGSYKKYGASYTIVRIEQQPEEIPGLDKQTMRVVMGTVSIWFRCTKTHREYKVTNNQKPASVICAIDCAHSRNVPIPLGLDEFAMSDVRATFSNPMSSEE